MASIDRTAYPRFKRVVSAWELAEVFTPTSDEAQWARGATPSRGAFCWAPAPGPIPRSGWGRWSAAPTGSSWRAVDLELRREGTILGARQKGATDLKLASLRRDKELVAVARRVAFDLVDGDPALDRLPELADEIRLLLDEEDRTFMFKS